MNERQKIFKEVWVEWFGDNEQLDIVMKHDYIFEAMERYAKSLLKQQRRICAEIACTNTINRHAILNANEPTGV